MPCLPSCRRLLNACSPRRPLPPLACSHVAECILAELQDAGGNNYTTPLEAWLAAYPREQLYLTQYERLTASGETEGLVADVKR